MCHRQSNVSFPGLEDPRCPVLICCFNILKLSPYMCMQKFFQSGFYGVEPKWNQLTDVVIWANTVTCRVVHVCCCRWSHRWRHWKGVKTCNAETLTVFGSNPANDRHWWHRCNGFHLLSFWYQEKSLKTLVPLSNYRYSGTSIILHPQGESTIVL